MYPNSGKNLQVIVPGFTQQNAAFWLRGHTYSLGDYVSFTTENLRYVYDATPSGLPNVNTFTTNNADFPNSTLVSINNQNTAAWNRPVLAGYVPGDIITLFDSTDGSTWAEFTVVTNTDTGGTTDLVVTPFASSAPNSPPTPVDVDVFRISVNHSFSYTTYISLDNGNADNDPSTSSLWVAVDVQFPPIFSIVCTTAPGAPGNVVLLALGDTVPVTIPSAAFIVGKEYSIYVQEVVSVPSGMTFVGYR